MIRYALVCDDGHAFEGWFRDSSAYDDHAARNLVSCPFCASTAVAKQVMAPRVARTDVARPAERPSAAVADIAPAVPPVAPVTDRERAFRDMVRAVRRHVAETAEHVGPRFAEEARRMHDGLSAYRPIWGEATPEDVEALAEEGIEAFPMPILPDERH